MQYVHNQRNGKKIFSVISAFVMSLCFMIPTASMADYDYSDTATGYSDGSSIYDEYLSWSQLDERWGSTPMGYSNIRSSGCLLTSLAIMAVESDSIDDTAMANMGITDIEQFNPGVLANAYTSVNGFTSGGAIASWGTINKLMPLIEWGGDAYFTSTDKYTTADEIRQKNSEGWYVIARVVTEYGGYHWVYIKSVDDDGNITMCDPAKQETDLYSAYPSGLQGEYWFLKGKNPPDGSVNSSVVDIPEDEYFVQNSAPVTVYSGVDGGSISATLTPGNVVSIAEYDGNYGLIESADFTGWVDVNLLAETEKVQQIRGDINNDGSVDKYDIALLNTYLQQKALLPDGISTLSAAELNAADINCDGVVDSNDVVAYIRAIAG
ncbi:MAG: dockerin type I repeat-containing protein [Ruminococcus flavefaciens]|nr:dockerin type I repeat-containing protein [Ruminococcus flavefaciens]MCM1230466.1 dockerin type I repeat-containing protein [Ruminococcus flavefaciens]